jgi:ribosomal protein S9
VVQEKDKEGGMKTNNVQVMIYDMHDIFYMIPFELLGNDVDETSIQSNCSGGGHLGIDANDAFHQHELPFYPHIPSG